MTSNPLLPVVPVEPEPEPEETAAPRRRPSNEEFAAWGLMTAAVAFILFEHLVSALIVGLALFLILDRLDDAFRRHMGAAARPVALILVTLIAGGITFGIIALAIYFFRHYAGNVPAMMTKMADVLASTRAWLGGYGDKLIPEFMMDADRLKDFVVVWLKEHAAALKLAGGTISLGFVHTIMGMLLAILVFFRHVTHGADRTRGALAVQLTEKVQRFVRAFAQIATAQLKISAVNTALTAIYLLVALPLFGKHIPFATTIVFVCFVCGLIPVLGNLISNTVIVILSMGISVGTAIASLLFLILVHKLEYLINSRIVGSQTDSQAWEILMAILIGETAFGVAGVVMAPIIYAFAKRELREWGLV